METKEQGRKHREARRLTKLWEVGIRAKCDVYQIVQAINGTAAGGWDVDYILARYRETWGRPIKRETLMRLYAEDKAQAEARRPAHISPSLRADLDKLGKALYQAMAADIAKAKGEVNDA